MAGDNGEVEGLGGLATKSAARIEVLSRSVMMFGCCRNEFKGEDKEEKGEEEDGQVAGCGRQMSRCRGRCREQRGGLGIGGYRWWGEQWRKRKDLSTNDEGERKSVNGERQEKRKEAGRWVAGKETSGWSCRRWEGERTRERKE